MRYASMTSTPPCRARDGKCLNNTITAMTFLAMAEGLAVGSRLGLDGGAMNAVVNESTGGSWNHEEPQ